MQLYPKDALPIHRPEMLLSARAIREQHNDTYYLFQPTATKDAIPRKIARLMPGGISVRNLVRVSQMSPNQIRIGIEAMLTRVETVTVEKSPIDVRQSYRFDRSVDLSGAFIPAKSVRLLREQRTGTASWITSIIQAQPIPLFVMATNEASGVVPESIQSCGARLAGFEHAEYNSSMFYEPIVESATGKRGLLPLGFRPRAGIFAEVN